MNEETFKNHHLVPYLHSLGFDASELTYEFRIRVPFGRKTIVASSTTGILDILVTRNEQNLFVVEAKGPNELLTDQDRDQGISYARLVTPIAPLVLVTNGNEWRIYDTLTKKELSDTPISPDYNFTVCLPQNLVEDARAFFLGLSKANLAEFSRLQVSETMRPLIGSKSEPQRKFIPELFVARTAFNESIERFYSESKVLFALVADSGSGKTCCLCDLARERVQNQEFVLFYRGIALKGAILEEVWSDLGWTFSESFSQIGLVRRLAKICSDRPLVIAIDGIDEWEHPLRWQDLLDTAKKLTEFHNIRIVVSCKASVWGQFTTARGAPTGIELYTFGKVPDQGFILEPMSEIEFSHSLEKYHSFYGIGRGWEDVALDAAKKSPFFMRVLFEVAQKKQAEFIVLSSLEYFEEYLQQSISRLKKSDDARHVLDILAGELFRRGEESLPRSEALKIIAPVSSDLLDELVEFQILESNPTNPGPNISFYFSLLRDYIIAFRSQQWRQITKEEFSKILAGLKDSTVHQEAIVFFYRYAPTEQQRLLDSESRHRAAAILNTYDTILSTDLRPLRDRFVPFTNGPIGYIGTFVPGTGDLGFSRFRALTSGDEKILLLPVLGRRLYDSNLPFLHEGHGIIGATAIGDRDPAVWTLNCAIGHQLRQIIEKGRLQESGNLQMVAEDLACTVSRSRSDHGHEPHPARLRQRPPAFPRQKPDLFPLDTAVVKRWLRYRILHRFYRERLVAKKLATGEIPIENHKNGSFSYSPDLTHEEMKDLDRQVLACLGLGEHEVRQLAGTLRDRNYLRALDDRITRAVGALEAMGIRTLEDEIFPERESILRQGMKAKAVCTFLERAYSMAFEALNSVLRDNFPTLYHHFPSVHWQPVTVVIAVRLERGKEEWHSGATIYVCRGDGIGNRFIARPADQVKLSMTRDPMWRFEVKVDDLKLVRCEYYSKTGALGQRSLFLNRILGSGDYYLDSNGGSTLGVGARIPSILRILVYDWLRQEVPLVFAELCRKYDIVFDSKEWTFFPQSR